MLILKNVHVDSGTILFSSILLWVGDIAWWRVVGSGVPCIFLKCLCCFVFVAEICRISGFHGSMQKSRRFLKGIMGSVYVSENLVLFFFVAEICRFSGFLPRFCCGLVTSLGDFAGAEIWQIFWVSWEHAEIPKVSHRDPVFEHGARWQKSAGFSGFSGFCGFHESTLKSLLFLKGISDLSRQRGCRFRGFSWIFAVRWWRFS